MINRNLFKAEILFADALNLPTNKSR